MNQNQRIYEHGGIYLDLDSIVGFERFNSESNTKLSVFLGSSAIQIRAAYHPTLVGRWLDWINREELDIEAMAVKCRTCGEPPHGPGQHPFVPDK